MIRDDGTIKDNQSRADLKPEMVDPEQVGFLMVTGSAQPRPKQLQSLAEQTRDARRALDEALHGISDAIELFVPKSDAYAKTLRQFNASVVLEMRNSLRAWEDIRKFFLDQKHEEEIKRLREFVELCERLQSLKQTGFLHAISDTILKL